MKKTIADLHVHTCFSPDSSVTMQRYIEVALERGIGVLCFTDHVDCTEFESNFDPKKLERRAVEFEQLKKQYRGQLKLLLGVEFGEPHQNPKEFEFVSQLGLDMIIGSVHHPLDKHLHSPDGKFDCVRQYNDCVFDMLNFGGFDVLGHIDMPKRYQQFIEDYREYPLEIQANLKLCAKKGIVPELNTSTLRKGLTETMPSIEMIKYYQQCGGVYVTINSDSHRAVDLGAGFVETKEALPTGLKCCYFENRKLIEL